MSGPELQALRIRYGLTRQQIADIMGLQRAGHIYQWESEYIPIPKRHQLRLAILFLNLARRVPPTEPCPYCAGSGLARAPQPQGEDTGQ